MKQKQTRNLLQQLFRRRGTRAEVARQCGVSDMTLSRWIAEGGSPLDSFTRFFDALLAVNRDGARIVLEWFLRRYHSVPFVGTWTPARLVETFGAVFTAEIGGAHSRSLREAWWAVVEMALARVEMLDALILADDERRGAILAGVGGAA